MYNKNTVFWAACFGMLLFGIGLITLGSMATDLKQKFALDEVGIGTLFSLLPFGILGGSLLFGPVCDRYGYKTILILACFGMFIGFEGIAYLTSLSALKVCIFLFGVCAGIINGATNAVVSDISKGAEGAKLSLLGVFFGIGALGMPFLIGILKSSFSSFSIIAAVGILTLVVGFYYSFIRFPPSKKAMGMVVKNKNRFFKDSFLYFIAFYLFFQGSTEAIVNNWTTSYLTQHISVAEAQALYALSLYVVGMTVMRLFIGSVLKSVPFSRLMGISLGIIFLALVILKYSGSYSLSIAGLILIGIGLAAGFPIMLGLAGNRFAAQSGTAFSFIFTISLLGNMLINYLMGIISNSYGIKHFTTMAFIELAFMVVLCIFIFRTEKHAPDEEVTVNEPQAAAI